MFGRVRDLYSRQVITSEFTDSHGLKYLVSWDWDRDTRRVRVRYETVSRYTLPVQGREFSFVLDENEAAIFVDYLGEFFVANWDPDKTEHVFLFDWRGIEQLTSVLDARGTVPTEHRMKKILRKSILLLTVNRNNGNNENNGREASHEENNEN